MAESCNRCGLPTTNAHHRKLCRRVPRPEKLVEMLKVGEYSPKTLAARYSVSQEFVMTRMRLSGITGEEIEQYSHDDKEYPRCHRCDIIIIDEENSLHPSWKLRVQQNLDGLCPGCHQFESTGHELLMTDSDVLTSVFAQLSIQ